MAYSLSKEDIDDVEQPLLEAGESKVQIVPSTVAIETDVPVQEEKKPSRTVTFAPGSKIATYEGLPTEEESEPERTTPPQEGPPEQRPVEVKVSVEPESGPSRQAESDTSSLRLEGTSESSDQRTRRENVDPEETTEAENVLELKSGTNVRLRKFLEAPAELNQSESDVSTSRESLDISIFQMPSQSPEDDNDLVEMVDLSDIKTSELIETDDLIFSRSKSSETEEPISVFLPVSPNELPYHPILRNVEETLDNIDYLRLKINETSPLLSRTILKIYNLFPEDSETWEQLSSTPLRLTKLASGIPVAMTTVRHGFLSSPTKFRNRKQGLISLCLKICNTAEFLINEFKAVRDKMSELDSPVEELIDAMCETRVCIQKLTDIAKNLRKAVGWLHLFNLRSRCKDQVDWTFAERMNELIDRDTPAMKLSFCEGYVRGYVRRIRSSVRLPSRKHCLAYTAFTLVILFLLVVLYAKYENTVQRTLKKQATL